MVTDTLTMSQTGGYEKFQEQNIILREKKQGNLREEQS